MHPFAPVGRHQVLFGLLNWTMRHGGRLISPSCSSSIFTGFRTGALERGLNAPQWGHDGWIYFGRGWGGGTITGTDIAAKSPPDGYRMLLTNSSAE